MTVLVVIAKACVPGRVKTRLHPEFTLEQAAALAAASLSDTLDAARAMNADRRILYLDGDAHGIACAGFDVVAQAPGSLDERLAAVFDLLDEPTVLLGMDTPQVRRRHVHWPTRTDAVLGLAEDGGFWSIGMREPRGDVIRGVAMSRSDSGMRQLQALRRAGLSVEMLPTLRDVDTADDAAAVAADIPRSSFARAHRAARARTHVA